MDISILNLSDIPAKISDKDYESGIKKLKEMWYNIHDFLSDNENINNNVLIFNTILSNDEDSCILFSSWWNSSINHIKKVNIDNIRGKNILIWFSDVLHIFSIYNEVENIFCLYGPTLRNIVNLSDEERKNFNSFILDQYLDFKIQQIAWWDEYHWKIFWWHALIFSQLFEYFNFQIKWSLLFLEFHGMEDYLIKYVLDVLNLKWVFWEIKWIILNQWVDSRIIKRLKSLNVNSIYVLKDVLFVPLYKDITIRWWKLLMENK